ncbi:MAG: CBS domain-containing protein [Nitrospiraceae bacterium]|nr:CBS domain-containing protein [Nitrospiraceae bacterium]
MDIITSHLNADFDALSSMIAARILYPGAWMVFPGSQEKKVRDFIKDFHTPGIKKLKDVDPEKVKRLIIVDAKSPDRLGPLAGLLARPDVEVHLYDHHPRGEGDIRGKLEIIQPVGATVTILIEILRKRKLKPAPLEATAMGLGVYEETGGLIFPSTTERDIQAYAYLFKCGASPKIIESYRKAGFGRQEISLLNELLENSRDLIIRGLRVKVAKAAAESYMGDAAQLAHSIMDAEDIDALLMMVSMEGKIVVVGRSRAPEIDVARVVEDFGGGGHRGAASATVADMPLEILEEKLVESLKRHVRPETVAGDVMTRPVVTIDFTATIAEAEKMMTRYGVNVLPVLGDSLYRGMISREVVEKALFHGFAKTGVMGFTVTDASTVRPETPIGEVEALMVERNQRFMPVLDVEGGILGAITRTDILRVLYEDYLRRSRIPPGETGLIRPHLERNLAKNIKEQFPDRIVQILRLAGQTADELALSVYMVGGSVRDLLRGTRNLDIDLVVEGDAIGFARVLAAALGARLRTHERFGTAIVILPDLKLDVATARTEYYEFPAALPKVEVSSIKRDLQRRDFTINTLAVKLNRPNFGLLVDFFGGRRDLRDKTIRVLHDLSFIEDPTRAFRAVRFAVRFGFKLSRHTEELLKSALEMDLFGRLSGSRLYEELRLIFKETEPAAAIGKLAEYGLLKVLHPAMKKDETLSGIRAAHDALLWFGLSFTGEPVDRAALYLMALLSGLGAEEIGFALRRLQVSSKTGSAIAGGIEKAREVLAKRLAAAKIPESAVELYEVLNGLPIESLLLAMALAGEEGQKKAVSRYLLELRRERPLLKGADLAAMGFTPGPLFSRIFRAILHERLKGNLASRQDEERFVRTHFRPSTSCIS